MIFPLKTTVSGGKFLLIALSDNEQYYHNFANILHLLMLFLYSEAISTQENKKQFENNTFNLYIKKKDYYLKICTNSTLFLYLYLSSKNWYSILASPFGWADRRASTFITKSLALKEWLVTTEHPLKWKFFQFLLNQPKYWTPMR